MIDYMLKFASKEEALELLYKEVEVSWDTEEDGTRINIQTELEALYPFMDVLGTVTKPTGNMVVDDLGDEYPEVAPVEGWHVNIRSYEELPELEQYRVYPKTPTRVWA